VFQPFGTDRFEHRYKTLILTGYGIVAALSIATYYWASLRLTNHRYDERWTIFCETIDLFISMILGLLMCYFYFLIVFDLRFEIGDMMEFLKSAASVSLLPVLSLFAYLFVQYRDLRRSSLTISNESKEATGSQMITLKGNNKDDVINTKEDDIIYIKAEDNYVILHLKDGKDKIGRHMIRITMKQINAQLSEQMFFQCHRSHIVNTSMIQSISGNKNDTKVIIDGFDKAIPVSRSKVDQIRSFYRA